jgi:tetratricopeptide (TPR) repeat protein
VAVIDLWRRILRCGVAASWLLSAATATAQSQPAAPVHDARERLGRISADLFSATPHLTDDIRDLKEILAADTSNAQAHMLLGIAYRGLGSQEMTSEAIAELRQAISLSPGFVPARLYLAYMYLDIGRPQRARDEIEAALQQSPGNPQLLALAGEAERQLRNTQRALELTQQSLQLDPSSAEARYYLGLALFDLGKRTEAMKELEQVVGSGQAAPDAYLSLGTLYVEAGRFDDAVKTLTRGTAIDPSRADLHIQLARAYRSQGLLDKAAEQLGLVRPARRSPGGGGPKPGTPLAPSEFRQQQLELDLALEQGALDLQRGRLTAAIAAFKKVLAVEPASGPANRYLAQIYLREASYAAAAHYASRAEQAGVPLSAEERRLLQEGLRGK